VEECACDVGEVANSCSKWHRRTECGCCQCSPTWAEDVVIQRVVKARDLQTVERDDATPGARHAVDESVQAKSAQVERHGAAQ
jgi:hypothetical protein